jgi:multiple sugar transport system substrate-binding protein
MRGRKWLAVLLALAVTVLAGCTAKGGSQTGQGDADGTVTLEFWHGMDENTSHGKVLKQLVDQFNREHTGKIEVKASFQGSYSELEKKLTSAIAAKTQPAVVQVTDSILTGLVNAGTVRALDGDIPAAELADYIDALIRPLRFDGKLHALPFNKSTVMLAYNKNVIKNPPRTWEEFKQLAKEAAIKDQRYGLAFEANVYHFGTLFAQAGGEWLKDGKAAFHGEAGQQALQLIVDMARNGSAIQLKPNEYASDYFNQGRAAMIVPTSASLAYIKPEKGDPWAVAPLFAGPKGEAVPIAGANLVVMNGRPDAETKAALTFIRWLTSKESTLTWAMGKTGYGPVRKSALADDKWKQFVQENPAYGVIADGLTKGVTQPGIPKWSAIQKEISAAVEAAVLGRTDVKTALADAAKKADNILSKP